MALYSIQCLEKNPMPRILVALALLCFAVSAQAQTATPSQSQSSDRVVQLLKELTDAPGPPGYEEEVRKLMAEHMREFTPKVSFDGLGSVIAQQGDSGPRIMLDAHMDELGGMVRRVLLARIMHQCNKSSI